MQPGRTESFTAEEFQTLWDRLIGPGLYSAEWRNPAGEIHRDDDFPAVAIKGKEMHWYTNGRCDRGGDLPSSIDANGTLIWMSGGSWHRDNGLPALVHRSGTKQWYVRAAKHRENGPAIQHSDGSCEWYWRNRRHRGEGLPALILRNGKMSWYEHGEYQGNQDNPPENAVFPGQQTKSASKR